MLQSGARASKAMSWTTSDSFVLERQKRTFRRNPRRTKLLFRACKTLDFPLLKWPFQGICTRNLFQKYKHVWITTVSDTSLIVLALCDVITDTAFYRHCCHVFQHENLQPLGFYLFSGFTKSPGFFLVGADHVWPGCSIGFANLMVFEQLLQDQTWFNDVNGRPS